jgi:sporulation protein YlmC with PRC-barrel domain
MLRNLKDIIGLTLRATDGDAGKVRDYYIDTVTWSVRYMVARSGGMTRTKSVLLSPVSVTGVSNDAVSVNIMGSQVPESPDVDMDRPLTSTMEADIVSRYRWPHYWQTEPSAHYGSIMVMEQEARVISARALTGYDVMAIDGEAGTVKDLVVDDATWKIISVIVSPGMFSKNVSVPSQMITSIDRTNAVLNLSSTIDQVNASPQHD